MISKLKVSNDKIKKLRKKDLLEEPELDKKDPFDIYYDIKEEREKELSESDGAYTSKHSLEFYDKMDKAYYHNRCSDFEELDEKKTLIRMNYKFAMCWPKDILRIIKKYQKKNKEFDLHEYPRYNCYIYFDLDDKKKEVYNTKDEIYRDLVLLMTEVIDSLIKCNKTNKEFLHRFDYLKLSVHCDSAGLNSLHVIYNDKVFYNNVELKKFMSYVKYICENNIEFTKINKIIDYGVYNNNHSIRCYGAEKVDDHGSRKFIKHNINNKLNKLDRASIQICTEKDIISNGKLDKYCIKIPLVKNTLSKKYYAPTDLSIMNNIADRFQSFAPGTYLSYEVNNMFCFNILSKSTPYICPACENEHSSNGWFGFIHNDRGYAGCHGSAYRNSPQPRWLFTINMKEHNKRVAEMEEENMSNLVMEIIDNIKQDNEKDPRKLKSKKWSFCDYARFVRSKDPTKLEDVIEYLFDTVIHVIDCGKDRLYTKSHMTDGSIGINQVQSVFDSNIKMKVLCDSEDNSTSRVITIDIGDLYKDHIYNYCSYDYIDFMPHLDRQTPDFLCGDIASPLGDSFLQVKNVHSTPYSTFNLFQGFKHKYIKMTAEEMKSAEKMLNPWLSHIDILTHNSSKLTSYVINWMAHIIQNPGKKTKVGLAFYSRKEQTGKNIFWDFFSDHILGSDLSRSVNSIEALTQKFNKASEGKLLTIGNEISSYNKHRDCGILRSLLTDILQEIHPKNFEPYKIKDFCNYVFLTNNFDFMRIKVNDKRYLPMECDCSKVGDTEYFNNLYKNMMRNKKLIFNYLANLDISEFVVTNIPGSKMKDELTIDGLPMPLKFINSLLEEDETNMYEYLDIMDTNGSVKQHKKASTIDFYKSYKKWSSEEGEYGCIGKTEFYRILTTNGIFTSRSRLEGIAGRKSYVNINYKSLEKIASGFLK